MGEELMVAGGMDGEGDDTDEGWCSTHMGDESTIGSSSNGLQKVQDIDVTVKQVAPVAEIAISDADYVKQSREAEADDIPDMEMFEENNLEEEDSNTVTAAVKDLTYLTVSEPDDFVKTRTYDITICYDKYYRTPRVFLFGYDENRQALSNEQIMQDISAEHAHKTVTVETHPHFGIPYVSIHPCKHAEVMKRIVDQLSQQAMKGSFFVLFCFSFPSLGQVNILFFCEFGLLSLTMDVAVWCLCETTTEETVGADGKGAAEGTVARRYIRVDQYLFLFLKFISTVLQLLLSRRTLRPLSLHTYSNLPSPAYLSIQCVVCSGFV